MEVVHLNQEQLGFDPSQPATDDHCGGRTASSGGSGSPQAFARTCTSTAGLVQTGQQKPQLITVCPASARRQLLEQFRVRASPHKDDGVAIQAVE